MHWEEPDGIGASAISSYDLRYIRSDATDKADANWTLNTGFWTTGERVYDQTGLTVNVRYDVQVRAVNSAGAGPWSTVAQGRTMISPPRTPTITGVVAGDGSFAVSWSAPALNGGTDITRYDVRYIKRVGTDRGGSNWTVQTAWSSGDGALQHTVSSIDNESDYEIQMRAANSVGAGDWSSSTTLRRNHKPRFPATETGKRTVDENTPSGRAVGAPVQASDDEGDVLTYSIAESDSAFSIDVASGQLRTSGALDHEATATHTVTVRVSDGKDYRDEDSTAVDATMTVTVTVNDLNEPPTVLITTADATLFGGRPLRLAATANDPDGDNLTYAWTSSGGGSFDRPAALSPTWTAPAATATEQTITLTLTVTDAGTLSATDAVHITVPPNQPPDVSVAPTSAVVNGGGLLRLDGSATDPEGQAMTYTWSSGGGTFANASALDTTWRAPVATSSEQRFVLTLTVTDSGGESATVTVDVTVPDQTNEAPAVAATTSQNRVNGGGSVRLDGNATDPQGDRMTYAWTSDGGGTFTNASAVDTIWTAPPADTSDRQITLTLTVTDSNGASSTATVGVIVLANQPPRVMVSPTAATVAWSQTLMVTGTAVDPEGDGLTYFWSSSGGGVFDDLFATRTIWTAPAQSDTIQIITLTLTAIDDGAGGRLGTAGISVLVGSNRARSGSLGAGGGGGGGGGAPPVPVPSDEDFDWNVTRDIGPLDRENDMPTGVWSDGSVFWVVENAATGADRLFAYELESGERSNEHEFKLDRRNRFSHGIWSDGETVWIADSGQDKLIAYDLETGERLPERDIELAERNRDPRGIWSDGETFYVLDSVRDALFAYDLESGVLLAEYPLDKLNKSPRGLWSDGLNLWVSDDGAKRIFAYRIVDGELRRIEEEEFSFRSLLKAGNGNPRGIWSDGDIIYVADEQDRQALQLQPPRRDHRLAWLAQSDRARTGTVSAQLA